MSVRNAARPAEVAVKRAGMCGFANESHLSVLFKKSTGLSMRDYRKQNRELPDD